IAQAISVFRAAESGMWASTAHPVAEASCEEYDFFRVLGFMQAVLTEDYLWDDFFRRTGIQPVELWYEDIVDDPAAAVFRVARAVQETAGVQLVRREKDVRLSNTLRVQRDARSADFGQRL